MNINDILKSKAGAKNSHLEPKRHKFNAKKVTEDGITFDSKKEAKRYKDLRIMLNTGQITYLARQVEFNLSINGSKIANYIADFVYCRDGKTIVEDVKSDITRKLPVYRLKKKMMLAQHGIEIIEF